jgi:hypothetical protein
MCGRRAGRNGSKVDIVVEIVEKDNEEVLVSLAGRLGGGGGDGEATGKVLSGFIFLV